MNRSPSLRHRWRLVALMCTITIHACIERTKPDAYPHDTGPTSTATSPEVDTHAEPRAEICTGGADEDGDGLIDCADDDCSGVAACLEDCDNGSDDDLNGLTDCDDPSCSEDRACPEACGNAADDDADGLVDCADPECSDSPRCMEDCENGLDDDADGLIDCADAECLSDDDCPENCSNGTDDDADTLVDCADPDCADHPTACIEDCENAVDDNADGLVDCADPACSEDAACPEDCTNGIDDDADGLTDCADPECSDAVTCPEDCENGIDDDADSLVDCADPECSDAPTCPEDCENGTDDDADGLVDCADPECADSLTCPEDCSNGVDDDTDGLIDCEDAECAGSMVCSEACGDGVDNDLDGLEDCEDDDCWPYCMDVTMQVLGGSDGWSRRTQKTSTHWGAMHTTNRYTSRWSNSFTMVSGTMAVQRPSSTAVTSCAWTAHGVQLNGARRQERVDYWWATTQTSWNISITRSATSTSGACGVGASWFLPVQLRADRLAAGVSPSAVSFDVEHRGRLFAHNWYQMGLPSPALIGSNYSASAPFASHTFRRNTHSWSSAATLSAGSPFVLEDMVIP